MYHVYSVCVTWAVQLCVRCICQVEASICLICSSDQLQSGTDNHWHWNNEKVQIQGTCTLLEYIHFLLSNTSTYLRIKLLFIALNLSDDESHLAMSYFVCNVLFLLFMFYFVCPILFVHPIIFVMSYFVRNVLFLFFIFYIVCPVLFVHPILFVMSCFSCPILFVSSCPLYFYYIKYFFHHRLSDSHGWSLLWHSGWDVEKSFTMIGWLLTPSSNRSQRYCRSSAPLPSTN